MEPELDLRSRSPPFLDGGEDAEARRGVALPRMLNLRATHAARPVCVPLPLTTEDDLDSGLGEKSEVECLRDCREPPRRLARSLNVEEPVERRRLRDAPTHDRSGEALKVHMAYSESVRPRSRPLAKRVRPSESGGDIGGRSVGIRIEGVLDRFSPPETFTPSSDIGFEATSAIKSLRRRGLSPVLARPRRDGEPDEEDVVGEDPE